MCAASPRQSQFLFHALTFRQRFQHLRLFQNVSGLIGQPGQQTRVEAAKRMCALRLSG